MPGGLLNIVSTGSANLILTGNPTKTFFKAAYSKYTNFGLQKFRLDFDGMRDLRITEPSKYTFKVKRYGDLLMDTYLVVNLPDIWSPIWTPSEQTGNQYSPYDYKWIDNIGTQLIQEIEISCGSVLLQKYSGQYLTAMINRDFDAEKKALIDTSLEMSQNLRIPRIIQHAHFLLHTKNIHTHRHNIQPIPQAQNLQFEVEHYTSH